MKKGFGFTKTTQGKEQRKAVRDFLFKVLQATHDSNGSPQVVYRLLRANLDKLDDNFASVLRRSAEVKLSEVKLSQARSIAIDTAVPAIMKYSYK